MQINILNIKKPDLVIAYILLIMFAVYGCFLLFTGKNFYLPLILLIFTVFYVLTQKKFVKENFELELQLNKSLFLINEIVFIYLLIISIWFVAHPIYSFQIIYYITILLMGLTILVSIFNSKSHDWLVLMKMVILITIIRAGLVYLFPVNGLDFLYHANFANYIASTGSIHSVDYVNYGFYPLFHIFLATMKLFFSLSTNNLIFLSGIFQSIILAFIIYSIGKKMSDNRILALMSSFLYLIMSPIITGYQIPNMFGLIYFGIIFLIVFGTKKIEYSLIFLICTAAVILTHPYPPINVLMIMVALFITLNVIKLQKINFDFKSFFTRIETIILFSVLFICYSLLWAFNNLVRGVVLDAFGTENVISGKTATIAYSYLTVYNDLYYYLFLGFVLIGLFFWLKKELISQKRIFIVALTFLLIFGFFGIQVLGLSIVPLPSRMIPYIFIPASILGAQGIAYFANMLKSKNMSFNPVIISIVLTTILCFSLTSANISPDIQFYSGKIDYRQSLNISELSGMNFLIDKSNLDFESDYYYRNYVRYQYGSTVYKKLYRNEIKNTTSLFILRSYLLDNSYLRLLSDFENSDYELSRSEFEHVKGLKNSSTIYENGNVWIYKYK